MSKMSFSALASGIARKHRGTDRRREAFELPGRCRLIEGRDVVPAEALYPGYASRPNLIRLHALTACVFKTLTTKMEIDR